VISGQLFLLELISGAEPGGFFPALTTENRLVLGCPTRLQWNDDDDGPN